MADNKCPFCGARRVRYLIQGNQWSCGTSGPDIDGEYKTGIVCDRDCFCNALVKSDDKVKQLESQLAALRKQSTEFAANVMTVIRHPAPIADDWEQLELEATRMISESEVGDE